MDVGNPSNFIRIRELFNRDLKTIQQNFSSYSFTDKKTKEIMKKSILKHLILRSLTELLVILVWENINFLKMKLEYF